MDRHIPLAIVSLHVFLIEHVVLDDCRVVAGVSYTPSCRPELSLGAVVVCITIIDELLDECLLIQGRALYSVLAPVEGLLLRADGLRSEPLARLALVVQYRGWVLRNSALAIAYCPL